MPYSEKRKHYLSQNLMASSLHEQTYEYNPGFRSFIENSGLPFQPHAEFKKADLDHRQDLYRRLAEKTWDPRRLTEILT